MDRERIRVLLFDLGGVLVRWDGIDELMVLADGTISREQARRFFLESPWMILFENGSCTPREFACGVVDELNLPMQADEFLTAFISWDRGFFPGALELLDRLKPRFLLACLSNNNPLHWNRLCGKYGLRDRFHRLYASHETGLVKPSQQAFEYVLKDMGGRPEEYLFFDDNRECVETARLVGFSARRVAGVDEVQGVLGELGLLPC